MRFKQLGFKKPGGRSPIVTIALALAVVLLLYLGHMIENDDSWIPITTSVTTDGGVTVIAPSMPFVIGLFLVGAIFLVLAFITQRRVRWLIVSGTFLLFVGPTELNQRVTIDRQHITVRGGNWWSPDIQTVYFSDLTEIDYTMYKGKKYESAPLICYLKDGSSGHLGDIDLLAEGNNALKFLQIAREHNVKVVLHEILEEEPDTADH